MQSMAILMKVKLWGDKALEVLAGVLMIIIAVLMLIQVFCRGVLDAPIFWVEEIVRLCQIWVVFIVVPLVQKRLEHPGFNAIPKMLPLLPRKTLLIFSNIVIAILGVAMAYYGVVLMKSSYAFLSTTGISRAIFVAPVVIGGAWTVVESLVQSVALASLKEDK